MKLLVYAPQMAPYGGLERHVCGVAALMAARGHRVELLTTSRSLGAPLRAELAAARVRLHEFPVERGRASKTGKLLWLFWRSWCLRAAGWDLVYTNGQGALARVVWLVARKGARRVHHHHTAADAVERAGWTPGFRRVLREAGEVVACSHATAAAIRSEIGRDDVAYLPYLTPSLLPPSAVVEPASAPTPLRFGFVGRLIPEKGVDRVCALAEDPALEGIEWHLHGAGPAYPPAHFAGKRRIVYHGAYSGREEHARLLLNLDAVILPSSHNEGMPLSLIEAMSAGLPWVATDRGGTRELALAPGCSRLVAADAGHAELVAAVADLARALRAGELSRRDQRAAYDRAFSPDVVGARWAEYLEQPVRSAAPSSR